MKLVFLGPPGSGKGTQAAQVAEKCGIPKISIGDMFRQEMNAGTARGKQVGKHMAAGTLVPDGITIRMLTERLRTSDCTAGFVLDGFPRTIEQAQALEQITPIDAAINFVVPEQALIERIAHRLTCNACQAVYNTRTSPPQKEGVCDRCGGALIQRPDQTREAVRTRLAVYNQQTSPLISFYRKKKLLITINANKDIPQVTRTLFKRLEQLECR